MMLFIFLISLVSLASYLYCWNDIRRGRPHIVSLRQITLIMDRRVFNRWFGEPGADFRYLIAPDKLRAFIRRKRFYVYLEMLADAVCLLGAWRYMTGMAPSALEYWFMLVAGTCQGVNLVYSMWLVWKWGDQIREEIGGIDD